MHKYPFRIVECEAFLTFSLSIQPDFIIPSRKRIVRDCLQLYSEEKKKLKRVLVENEQRVCLSMETWTSIKKLNYMVLTMHFITHDWKLQKRILKFSLIPDHEEDTIDDEEDTIEGDTGGKLIEACLLEWGIEKVFTVTVDNASYNDRALA